MGDANAMLVYMRRLLGDETTNVSLARNIIAPITTKLRSAGGDLHRRCVLFDCAPSRVRVDDVCAALALPGGDDDDIEAVALCGYLVAAVVVFRTAAGASNALRGPARKSCHEIPLPLDQGIELPVVVPTHVKIMSESDSSPTTPEAANPEAGCASTPPEPSSGEPVTTRGEEKGKEEEPAPWYEFHDPSKGETFEPCEAGMMRMRPGTWFFPSAESLVRGPTRGADGSLWMHGDTYIKGTWGLRLDEASIRVKRIDPPPEAKQRRVPDHAIWFAPL